MAKTSNIHYCCGVSMADFAVSSQSVEHCYCRICGAHIYKGRRWTKEEWFNWINEEEFQRREEKGQQQEWHENCQHAHEMINHSNPESD